MRQSEPNRAQVVCLVALAADQRLLDGTDVPVGVFRDILASSHLTSIAAPRPCKRRQGLFRRRIGLARGARRL